MQTPILLELHTLAPQIKWRKILQWKKKTLVTKKEEHTSTFMSVLDAEIPCLIVCMNLIARPVAQQFGNPNNHHKHLIQRRYQRQCYTKSQSMSLLKYRRHCTHHMFNIQSSIFCPQTVFVMFRVI
jgi:hypothetical protein